MGRAGVKPVFPLGKQRALASGLGTGNSYVAMTEDHQKKKKSCFEGKRNLPIIEPERVVLFPHGRIAQCAARVTKKRNPKLQNTHSKPQFLFLKGHGNIPSNIMTTNC